MKSALIIADDHEVVRQGLRDIISRTTDLKIVGEAADGMAAETLARESRADLLVLDIGLPFRRGFQVLDSLRADGIAIPVLIFSMYSASHYVAAAQKKGAQGFVGKDADSGQLLGGIRQILAGGTWFDADQPRAEKPMAGDDPFLGLSGRESEVTQGLLAGQSLLHIARELGIQSKSVTTYRSRILAKLGVQNNAELILLATRFGYV